MREEEAVRPAKPFTGELPLLERHRTDRVQLAHEAHAVIGFKEVGIARVAKVRVDINALGVEKVLMDAIVEEVRVVPDEGGHQSQ